MSTVVVTDSKATLNAGKARVCTPAYRTQPAQSAQLRNPGTLIDPGQPEFLGNAK